MADDRTRDELAQLRAQLAAQQADFTAQLSALRAVVGRPRHRMPRHHLLHGRFLPLALVALLVLLTPLGLLAAGPFNDLTGGVHDANIQALYDAGITKGCVPNVSYCPTATVTREEMASFLARTAGLGTNPPVANAKALQGYAPSGLARVAAVKKGVAKIGVLGSAIDVATVTVMAPAAGFILITATANASTTATSGCPCLVYLGVNDRSPGGTATSGYSVAPLGNGTGLVEAVTTLAVTYAFPVAAGTRTYAAQMFYRTGTVPIGADTSLTALYVPFGYDGGTTLAPAP